MNRTILHTSTGPSKEPERTPARAYPAEVIQASRNSHDPVAVAVLRSQCVSAGEYAPDFDITIPGGGTRPLEDALCDGPLVILFRHGGWCGACTREIEIVRQIISEPSTVGATLVVVAPDSCPDVAPNTPPPADMLTVIDSNARVASVYGLTIAVPTESTKEIQANSPIIADNGERGNVVPAILIVDRQGVISWIAIDIDHSQPDNIIMFAGEWRKLRVA